MYAISLPTIHALLALLRIQPFLENITSRTSTVSQRSLILQRSKLKYRQVRCFYHAQRLITHFQKSFAIARST